MSQAAFNSMQALANISIMFVDDCSDADLLTRLRIVSEKQDMAASHESACLQSARYAEIRKREEITKAAKDLEEARKKADRKERIAKDKEGELKTLTGYREDWEKKALEDNKVHEKTLSDIDLVQTNLSGKGPGLLSPEMGGTLGHPRAILGFNNREEVYRYVQCLPRGRQVSTLRGMIKFQVRCGLEGSDEWVAFCISPPIGYSVEEWNRKYPNGRIRRRGGPVLGRHVGEHPWTRQVFPALSQGCNGTQAQSRGGGR